VSQNHSSSLATKTRADQLISDFRLQMPTPRVKATKAKINQKTIDVLVEDILSAAKASS
jgi:hypothetical protein